MAVFLVNHSTGGLDIENAPKVTFNGKWSGWYIEMYEGKPYWEALFIESGVATVEAGKSYGCDVFLIGGGAACYNIVTGNGEGYAGGSGYTAMGTGLTMTGSVPITVGAGGTQAAKVGGASSILGISANGAPQPYNSCAGGSGGGCWHKYSYEDLTPGGQNGGNAATSNGTRCPLGHGSGDGKEMKRFYDTTKIGDVGTGGLVGAPSSAGSRSIGGGGGLLWQPKTAYTYNYPATGFGAGGSCYSGVIDYPGNSGCVIVRILAE